MITNPSIKEVEGFDHECGSSMAIDIIMSPDKNSCTPIDSDKEEIGQMIDIGEELGRMEIGYLRFKIATHLLKIAETLGEESTRSLTDRKFLLDELQIHI